MVFAHFMTDNIPLKILPFDLVVGSFGLVTRNADGSIPLFKKYIQAVEA